jgi:uncharacterized membrane protein
MRNNTLFKMALLASLVANVLLGVHALNNSGRGQAVSERLTRKQVDGLLQVVPEERRKSLRSSVSDEMRELKGLNAEMNEQRRRLGAMIADSGTGEEELMRGYDELRTHDAAIQEQLHTITVRLLTEMTPEERGLAAKKLLPQRRKK